MNLKKAITNGNTTKYAEMIGLVSKILDDIDALYKMQ